MIADGYDVLMIGQISWAKRSKWIRGGLVHYSFVVEDE